MKKRILFVDDDQTVLDALEHSLHRQQDVWSMTYTSQPDAAWEQLISTAYDAVVADIGMPGIDGLDLLQRIRQHDHLHSVPVVMIADLNDPDLKVRVLELGAVDLLDKPIDVAQFVARLRNVLRLKADMDNLRNANDILVEMVRRQSIHLTQSRMNVACRLGIAAEYRDEETGNHVIRVGCYSRAIAAELGLPRDFQKLLFLAAPLHDIGKIGIPDNILLKPGPLTDEEWSVMQQHCKIGDRILRERSKLMLPLANALADDLDALASPDHADPMLEMAAAVALAHHERWDGSGYLRGLVGEQIPLAARIVALADVFDALTSDRPYRAARRTKETISIMNDTVGSHFEPRVHHAFLRALPEICAIRAQHTDETDCCRSASNSLVVA